VIGPTFRVSQAQSYEARLKLHYFVFAVTRADGCWWRHPPCLHAYSLHVDGKIGNCVYYAYASHLRHKATPKPGELSCTNAIIHYATGKHAVLLITLKEFA